jgi:S1-C subfamily serine protease
MPAVVAVQLKKPGNATDTGAAPSRVPKDAHFEDAFFEEFFNGKGTRATDAKDEVAHVSGFFISDEGLIVTRLPAIEPTQEISVIDDHGANYKAKLVGRHVETKIALLKIDSSRKFPRVAFSNRSVTIGEYLLKASNPFGLVGSASVTKVSGWQSFSELPQSIELNTPINKGEAGAAIFDLDGEVVGVGMGSRSDEKGTDHTGYALPANVVNYVVDQLRRTGAVLDRSGLANEFNRSRGISSTPANRLLIGVPSASVNNAQAGIVFISGYMGSGSERNTSVLGSGFVIDGKDGIIVTNNHVIKGADEIIVNFSDGNKLKVDKVLGKDTMTDLAVLKVTPKKPLASLPFGSSAKIRVGDWVMAIPFSRCARSWPCSSVTVGIISAKQRDLNSGPYDDYLQNDVAINRGDSGSPLFNMAGEVIGVNTAILTPTTGFIGIGVAKPSDTAVVVIDQLRQYGEVRRGWLGVSIQALSEDIAGALGAKENSGALVASVTPGSPAAKAGISTATLS